MKRRISSSQNIVNVFQIAKNTGQNDKNSYLEKNSMEGISNHTKALTVQDIKAIEFFRKENKSRIDIAQQKMHTWSVKMNQEHSQQSVKVKRSFEINSNSNITFSQKDSNTISSVSLSDYNYKKQSRSNKSQSQEDRSNKSESQEDSSNTSWSSSSERSLRILSSSSVS